MTAAGIFLTHRDSPRIRTHFDRLVVQSGDLVRWHFVLNPAPSPRPQTSFAVPDPAGVLPSRHAAMLEHGGVQGGYIDTLLVPVLLGLADAEDADRLWVCEYDVDVAGRWDSVFGRYADNDADLLTSTLRFRHEQPRWAWWRSARAPHGVPAERWVRSLNPLMRVSRRLLEVYVEAMAAGAGEWNGHYEFTVPTSALAAGLRLEDFGGDGSFVPPGREHSLYVGKPPKGRPAGLTFGFRPVRHHYFHERPEDFERPGMLYHPVKPGVAAWTRKTMNAAAEQA